MASPVTNEETSSVAWLARRARSPTVEDVYSVLVCFFCVCLTYRPVTGTGVTGPRSFKNTHPHRYRLVVVPVPVPVGILLLHANWSCRKKWEVCFRKKFWMCSPSNTNPLVVFSGLLLVRRGATAPPLQASTHNTHTCGLHDADQWSSARTHPKRHRGGEPCRERHVGRGCGGRRWVVLVSAVWAVLRAGWVCAGVEAACGMGGTACVESGAWVGSGWG